VSLAATGASLPAGGREPRLALTAFSSKSELTTIYDGTGRPRGLESGISDSRRRMSPCNIILTSAT
jgi:hypothetical protein